MRLNSVEWSCAVVKGLSPHMAEIICRFEASVPSREGVELLRVCGVSSPSRADCERKADAIGALLREGLGDDLDLVRQKTLLPPEVVSVTIGLDRVSVAYRERAPGLDGQPIARTTPYQRKPPERFTVEWRMDFVGNVSFRDAAAKVVLSFRYGLPHHRPGREIAAGLVKDVAWALGQCPTLKVSACQDGARELWPLLNDALDACEALKEVEVMRVVDFDHLRPRIERLRPILRWSQRTLDQMFKLLVDEDDGIRQVEQRVLADMPARMSTASDKTVNDFLSYLEGRTGEFATDTELFNYKRQRELGLPIGSGPVEATAKTLVSVRMKRSGCRWTEDGAHTLLSLRSLTQSDQRWTPIWSRFIERQMAHPIHEQPSNVVPLRP